MRPACARPVPGAVPALISFAVRVKCSPDDTIGDLKKLIAAQKGTKPEKVSGFERRGRG